MTPDRLPRHLLNVRNNMSVIGFDMGKRRNTITHRGISRGWSVRSARNGAYRLAEIGFDKIADENLILLAGNFTLIRNESMRAFKQRWRRTREHLAQELGAFCCWNHIEVQERGVVHMHSVFVMVVEDHDARERFHEEAVFAWTGGLLVNSETSFAMLTREHEEECNAGYRGQHTELLDSPVKWAKYCAKHQARTAAHSQRCMENFPSDWIQRDVKGGVRIRMRMWVMSTWFLHRYCDDKLQYELFTFAEVCRAKRFLRRHRVASARCGFEQAEQNHRRLVLANAPRRTVEKAARSVTGKRKAFSMTRRRYARACFLDERAAKDAVTCAELERYRVGESGRLHENHYYDVAGDALPPVAPPSRCFQRGQFFWNLRPYGDRAAPIPKREIQEMMGVSCWLPMSEMLRFLFPPPQPAIPALP